MSIIDNIKGVAEVVQKAGNFELYQKMLDVYKDALSLSDENKTLKLKIEELESKFKIKEEVYCERNALWIKKLDKGGSDGPFCTRCWDVERILVRLVPRSIYNDYYNCVQINCGNKNIPINPEKTPPVTTRYPTRYN